jgi:flagellar protein FliS
MNGKEIKKESWRIAAQSASPVGLVVILYDLLAIDLREAIAAMRKGDIERRSAELNHAFLVLMQLEGSLEMEKGGEAARNLARFYSHIRAKLLEAQIKQSAEILERQIELILDVRGAWQQAESRERTNGVLLAGAASAGAGGYEEIASSWSA